MATDALQYIFGLPSPPSSQDSLGGAAGLKGVRLNLQRALFSLSAEQCAALRHAQTVGLDLNRLVRKVAEAKVIGQTANSDVKNPTNQQKKSMGNNVNDHASRVNTAAGLSVEEGQTPAAAVEPTLFWYPERTDCYNLDESRGDRGKLCPLGYAPLPTSSAVAAAGSGSSSARVGDLMSMTWAEVLEACETRRAAGEGEERRAHSCCVRVDPWLLARVRASLLK